MAGSHSVIGAQPMQWLARSVGPRLDTGGSSLDARPGCSHLPAGMRQQPVGRQSPPAGTAVTCCGTMVTSLDFSAFRTGDHTGFNSLGIRRTSHHFSSTRLTQDTVLQQGRTFA